MQICYCSLPFHCMPRRYSCLTSCYFTVSPHANTVCHFTPQCTQLNWSPCLQEIIFFEKYNIHVRDKTCCISGTCNKRKEVQAFSEWYIHACMPDVTYPSPTPSPCDNMHKIKKLKLCFMIKRNHIFCEHYHTFKPNLQTCLLKSIWKLEQLEQRKNSVSIIPNQE
jgi:hypothetical protein